MHDRLREALSVVREATAAGEVTDIVERELLLFCHGFCTALTAHHEGEDGTLFPAIEAAHPQLRDTLRYLQDTLSRPTGPGEIERHLDGIAARGVPPQHTE